MKKVFYYSPEIGAQEYLDLGASEIIFATTYFSRFGKLSKKDLSQALKLFKDSELKLVFEWDILISNENYSKVIRELESLDLSIIDEYRVLDPGAYYYLIERKKTIQLLLDSGPFHNLEAIKTFIELGKGHVSKIILSLELDQEELIRICENIDVDIEYLGYGRILLFYTPRALVSPLFDAVDDWIEVSANSEESPHKGFPVIENLHGSFMFNPKDHFVLEYSKDLMNMGITHLRIDNNIVDKETLKSLVGYMNGDAVELKSIKSSLPRNTIRGFFHKNKSDALFKKLKNYRILRNDKDYIGQVIEVEKGEHVGIYLRTNLNNNDFDETCRFSLVTPEGKEKNIDVKDIKSSSGKEFISGKYGDIIFIPHVSGVSVKTNVYLESLS